MTFDYFDELAQQPCDLQDIDSAAVHYHRLISTDSKDNANKLRERWQETRLSYGDIPPSILDDLINVPDFDITEFPALTFWLQFPFRLTKAYLSKDERDFYIIDNPIRRDKVSRLPYVAPSSWKGSLRATLWNLGYEENAPTIRRLFGNERVSEEDFRAGRLRFFPTFFKRQGLEIINPHDRQRRVGKNPILFESVLPGTFGVFSLLYVPFDQLGGVDSETRSQVAKDLALIAKGVQGMFCTYGFGAKTNSGFGTAVNNFVNKRDQRRYNLPAGRVQLKAALRESKALSSFRENYGQILEFTPEEWREVLDDEEFQVYQAACAAYEHHRHNIETQQVADEIESFEAMLEKVLEWSSRLPLEVPDAESNLTK